MKLLTYITSITFFTIKKIHRYWNTIFLIFYEIQLLKKYVLGIYYKSIKYEYFFYVYKLFKNLNHQ